MLTRVSIDILSLRMIALHDLLDNIVAEIIHLCGEDDIFNGVIHLEEGIRSFKYRPVILAASGSSHMKVGSFSLFSSSVLRI